MGRRKKGRVINGIVLLDKAVGGSSNHVLQKVRWLYQAQKAGHTGALDPLASGMLPICLGEATKFSRFLLDSDKTYEVTAELGIRTTTSDADGEVVSTREVNCDEETIVQAVMAFEGTSKQVPSMFSALKYQGKPLYTYARQGIEVPREARDITVFSITDVSINLPFVSMTIHCSKGTYIRTIVDDLGENLGCGAYVSKLHRTKVAHYPNEKMMTIEQLEQIVESEGLEGLDALLLPMDTATEQLPLTHVDDVVTERFGHGNAFPVNSDFEVGDFVRVYDHNERFLGVGEYQADKSIQPKRVVVYEDPLASS
ncbi:tRNA pseudouridine(55) synthase TruB [Alteromonas sp. 5E99-2]|uniref:tRNA pseudouridine(55) synthase TruB n=1 Tax=Alteromonas sp. 5E99-2 TaxID=2817683 RepID=UPI001A98F2F1|nr:tRNA pseudouridine(55) synthase TruB [Alteromonas sp. 5E99-2]MBO1255586.1 tRNA pseudouridine(55) synthase TruB [Alteromonas sp. 5E99-2]